MALRIGLLGCGRIGQMHAELLSSRVSGAELALVCDVIPEAAEELGNRLGVNVAPSVDSVFAGGAVDAVAICATTDTHAELITRAARAGLPAFCEKPISLDLDTVDETLATVDRAGTLLQIGFNRRFDPAHQAVRDAVAGGSIGEVHVVKITSRDRECPPISYLERSGGMFLDMTIHDFDLARFLTGSDIVEVNAAVGAVLVDPAVGRIGDIDTAVVVLTHQSGCITIIDNSRQAVYGYDQRVEAFGSAGMATSENPPTHTGVLAGAAGFRAAPLYRSFIDRYEVSFTRQWQSFVDNVQSGAPPAVSGHDARVPLVAGLAAIESRATGRPGPVS
jgi:myo-inositol 2-dehydrogenase/D-chiro-inositol 1-dehydrogenase